MPRYRLTLEYDGRRFCGWQRQPKDSSVQQTIEDVLSKICEEKVIVYGAGRTDAGVHATGQVAHFSCEKFLEAFRVREGGNGFLRSKGVAIHDCEIVDDRFHARFSALSRTYIYTILNRRPPPVLQQGLVWHVPSTLDFCAMKEASSYFLGYHNFSSFRSIHCSAPNPIRTLDVFQLWQEGQIIRARVKSRAFLHNQVRIMVGTLVDIGKKKWPASCIPSFLQQADRTVSGQTAPPDGLCLVNVEYP